MATKRGSSDEGGFVDSRSGGKRRGPSARPPVSLVEALIVECMEHFRCSRDEALSRVVEAAEEVRAARYEANARAFGVLGANLLENIALGKVSP